MVSYSNQAFKKAADADGDLDVSHLSSAVCDAVDLGVHAGEEDLFERIQFDFAPVYQVKPW